MMFRVLYVSNLQGFLGGSERSLYDLLENLDRDKVIPFFASIYDRELAHAIKRLGIPFLRLARFDRKSPVPFVLTILKVIRFIREHQIDLIHNNRCSDAYYSWLPGKLTRTPVVIHHRDSRYYHIDRVLTRFADCNIAISSWQNRVFLNNRAVVVHNGIDLRKFPYSAVSNQRCDTTVTVGLVGRIAPIKGQDVFIEAARLVRDSNKQVRFRIYGDMEGEPYADYKRKLVLLAREYQLMDVLQFMGYAHDVRDALKGLDISVVPSLREPFGRVIIESMACCKPVVATNVGGALDIVTSDTGILVPPGDAKALADAILFLVNNPAIRETMGRRGRERVEKNFTIERTLEKLYELYAQILGKRAFG